MIYSELLEALSQPLSLRFELENGEAVPAHFHITEVGMVQKHFIDCGNVRRNENYAVLQLWFSNDINHRLSSSKLKSILQKADIEFSLHAHIVRVEYQGEKTIGLYDLSFSDGSFILNSTQTNCLASDACGINMIEETTASQACNSGSGCC